MYRQPIRKFICTEDYPVVKTTRGKIRGYVLDETFMYRGIRYAKAKRFMMPEPVDPWEGIKDAHDYGYICPECGRPEPYQDFLLPRRHWPDSEHCQYLNIWTQSLEDKARRPVMVWLHGGGFSAGSSLDLFAYDGEELSRRGNVVVVTLNHRVNLLGFLNLSAYGEKYKDSANVGMADIVAALQWIHDNIAEFGGDPDNVTIFGQSGGGGKVTTLMQMPAADGLYHKAIVQSGVLGDKMKMTRGQSLVTADKLVHKLGLTKENISAIETMDYRTIADAANAVAMEETGIGVSFGWAPVPGDDYPGDPVDVGFRKENAHIPMIVGTIIKEFEKGPVGNKALWNDEQRMAVIRERAGQKAKRLADLFAKAYPEMDQAYAAAVDGAFRPATVRYLEQRIHDAQAPVYNYVFTFESTFKGGMIIGHSCEIPFVFGNAAFTETLCKDGVTERLQNQMCNAWINFAYTGNPNHRELPLWKPYAAETKACMALGDVTVLKEGNFDGELMELLATLEPSQC